MDMFPTLHKENLDAYSLDRRREKKMCVCVRGASTHANSQASLSKIYAHIRLFVEYL
jgi:hypothetical protein